MVIVTWNVLSYHRDNRKNRHGHNPAELWNLGRLLIGNFWYYSLAQRILLASAICEGHIRAVASGAISPVHWYPKSRTSSRARGHQSDRILRRKLD